MHEMGIALEIIDIVKDHLPADKPAVKVERVNVQIGKLSAIVADSLRFCFDIAIQDTPVAGAKLIIEEVPVVARCNACAHCWTIDQPVFVCPICGGGSLNLLSGRELDIKSIEITE